MEIQLFNSPQFGQIRTAGTSTDPIFCASDVCRALGYSNGRKAIVDHCDEGDVTKCDTPTASGIQSMTFVNESGLFSLIFGSKLDSAKQFKRWVTSEVLPAIRKTGGYIQAKPEETPEETMAKAVLIATETIKLREQRIRILEGEKEYLEQENKLLAPKAQYTDEVLQSNEGYTFEQMAKQLSFRSVQKFTQELVDRKICYKRSDTYMLYAEYAENGYTMPRTHRFFHRDGTVGSRTYTVWTEKGRLFLHELFNVALQPVDLTMFDFPRT